MGPFVLSGLIVLLILVRVVNYLIMKSVNLCNKDLILKIVPIDDRDYVALIEVELFSTEESGRTRGIMSGYRGAHKVKPDYLTSGSIELIDVDILEPGEKALAFVNYITPEYYPGCLWPGKVMNVQEGGRVVGRSRIVEIYNEVLLGAPGADPI